MSAIDMNKTSGSSFEEMKTEPSPERSAFNVSGVYNQRTTTGGLKPPRQMPKHSTLPRIRPSRNLPSLCPATEPMQPCPGRRRFRQSISGERKMLQRPLFDPTAPGFLEDPYPFYARLREAEPWHLSPQGFYVVSRLEDVNFVMRDRRFGQNWIGPKINNADSKLLQKAIFRSIGQWMLKRDPPDHTRVRSCFAQAFTARRVDAMHAHIEAIADKVVEDIRPRGRMDAVAEFALAIPLISITDLLGVPQEDRDLMFRVSRFVGRLSDPVPFDPGE